MHEPTTQAVGPVSAVVHPEEIKASVDLRVGNSVSLKATVRDASRACDCGDYGIRHCPGGRDLGVGSAATIIAHEMLARGTKRPTRAGMRAEAVEVVHLSFATEKFSRNKRAAFVALMLTFAFLAPAKWLPSCSHTP
jgi:hypothetical protein